MARPDGNHACQRGRNRSSARRRSCSHTASTGPARATGGRPDDVHDAANGSVYPGWRTVISEVPELIGLIIAFVIVMITFGAFAAAGMPIVGAIIWLIAQRLPIARQSAQSR